MPLSGKASAYYTPHDCPVAAEDRPATHPARHLRTQVKTGPRRGDISTKVILREVLNDLADRHIQVLAESRNDHLAIAFLERNIRHLGVAKRIGFFAFGKSP